MLWWLWFSTALLMLWWLAMMRARAAVAFCCWGGVGRTKASFAALCSTDGLATVWLLSLSALPPCQGLEAAVAAGTRIPTRGVGTYSPAAWPPAVAAGTFIPVI